jgi:hypothetical protein
VACRLALVAVAAMVFVSGAFASDRVALNATSYLVLPQHLLADRAEPTPPRRPPSDPTLRRSGSTTPTLHHAIQGRTLFRAELASARWATRRCSSRSTTSSC